MARLWRTLLGRDEISRYSTNEYAADLAFTFSGSQYAIGAGTQAWSKTEDIENSFSGYIQALYKTNGVVFAVMAARRLLFKQANIMWQEFGDGVGGRLFWTPELEVFRRPWPNGTAGELLSRMDQDASLGGNFYAVREQGDNGGRLRRLRPDWMTIVLTAPPAEAVRSDVAGYWFHPGRTYTMAGEPEPRDSFFLPHEVCHWTPDPDPDALYRGMSWLTPVVREVMADKAATGHKEKFFHNGATLGAIISAKENLTEPQFKQWMSNILDQHQGVDNAYKPLFLASPVDVTLKGLDLRQLDFKVTQGHGETRICAAGRVPPIIVGVSEGLEAATYSNYGQARRAFGDGWAHPQWEDACGALETLVANPRRYNRVTARLWYDHSHIAFLREDRKDQASITHTQMLAIEAGVRGGFKPESVVDAVRENDPARLEHTGLYSVQLQPPGTGEDEEPPPPPEMDADAEDDDAGAEGEAERADRNQLKEYWLRGEGAGRWVRWTDLYKHLRKHMADELAKRVAAQWFKERYGFWPGADKNRVMHGKPPRGNRVGPG